MIGLLLTENIPLNKTRKQNIHQYTILIYLLPTFNLKFDTVMVIMNRNFDLKYRYMFQKLQAYNLFTELTVSNATSLNTQTTIKIQNFE